MYEHSDISLRKLSREDLPQLLGLKSESWPFTHRTTIANMDDQNRWFESLDSDVHYPQNLVLVGSKPSHANFGIFKISNVDWVNHNADVAWDVFENFRGMKLGKQLVSAGAKFCFDVLSLRRLSCEVLETNIASQKCAEWAGFIKEGVKRRVVLKNGIYVDSRVYGLLRD